MKTIQRGERIPFGLSLWQDVSSHGWQLRLPIFIRHGLHYDVTTNLMREGWKTMNILIRSEYQGFNFRWGWVLVKETAAPIPRYPL